MKIPLIKPYITDEVKDEVLKVLDSGFLTEGEQTRALEEAVGRYLNVSHVMAVCNCTLGLEMALRALGIGSGDEVIVPDYTYPATASVVNIVGADIVLVDVNPSNMLIDYDVIEKAITPKTKAILPVSLFGCPLDYTRLDALKKKYGIYVIEDAACSLGAKFQNQFAGSLADISVFSLHPRKFITTGEGGLVTTNKLNFAHWMNSYKHFGIGESESREKTAFVQIGTNYKLSNIQAAVGLVQMKHINKLLESRIQLAKNYKRMLLGVEGISLPEYPENGRHSFQSFCIFVEDRNRIMERLRSKGIEVQIGTYSLHMHPAFYNNHKCRVSGSVKGSEYAYHHCLTLPMYYGMTEEIQDQVVHHLVKEL